MNASPPPAPLESEYFCASCHTPFINGYPLDEFGNCAACRSGLRAFDRAASFGFYEGKLRSLIHLYKYSGMRPLARQLAVFLERAIPIDQSFDAVVAVPAALAQALATRFQSGGTAGSAYREAPGRTAVGRSETKTLYRRAGDAGRRGTPPQCGGRLRHP